MDKIIKFNREVIKKIDNFIDDSDYEKSDDLYGLPRHVYHLINKPINNDITYVDLLTFLYSYLGKNKINYLEIGVSVLKTFFQMANFFRESNLYAYDINFINPMIEKQFDKINNHEEILEQKGVNQYNFKDNNIFYFRGDVFKVKQLEKFKNNVLDGKVDILFSDAHHSFEGLMSEYKNLIYDILSDKFILYYDDLKFHGPTNKRIDMTDAFFLISRELKKKNKNLTVALLDVNGWLGNHEHKHTNGIITTLNLKQILSQNNINLNIQYFDL